MSAPPRPACASAFCSFGGSALTSTLSSTGAKRLSAEAGSAHKRSGTRTRRRRMQTTFYRGLRMLSMRAMKTITEFSGGTLRGAAQTRDRLKAEGVGDEALPERVSQELAVTGDRAARLIEALSVVVDRADRVRQVRVFAGADEPKGAKKIGEFSYLVDSVPDMRQSAGGGGKRKGGERGGRGAQWARPAASAARADRRSDAMGFLEERGGPQASFGEGWVLTRAPVPPGERGRDRKDRKPGGRGPGGDRDRGRGPGGGDRGRGPGGRGPGGPGGRSAGAPGEARGGAPGAPGAVRALVIAGADPAAIAGAVPAGVDPASVVPEDAALRARRAIAVPEVAALRAESARADPASVVPEDAAVPAERARADRAIADRRASVVPEDAAALPARREIAGAALRAAGQTHLVVVVQSAIGRVRAARLRRPKAPPPTARSRKTPPPRARARHRHRRAAAPRRAARAAHRALAAPPARRPTRAAPLGIAARAPRTRCSAWRRSCASRTTTTCSARSTSSTRRTRPSIPSCRARCASSTSRKKNEARGGGALALLVSRPRARRRHRRWRSCRSRICRARRARSARPSARPSPPICGTSPACASSSAATSTRSSPSRTCRRQEGRSRPDVSTAKVGKLLGATLMVAGAYQKAATQRAAHRALRQGGDRRDRRHRQGRRLAAPTSSTCRIASPSSCSSRRASSRSTCSASRSARAPSSRA